jgi:hypothetical protein
MRPDWDQGVGDGFILLGEKIIKTPSIWISLIHRIAN